MRRIFNICLVLAAVLAVSCSGRVEPVVPTVEDGQKTGNLTLSIGNSKMETKSDELKDGFTYNNVLVIIANNEGGIIDKVYKAYPYVQGAGDLQHSVSDAEVDEDKIRFKDLKVGAYQVYVYANIDHTAWQTAGSTVEDIEKALTVGGGATLDPDRLLRTLASGEVPAEPATNMLLTGHKELYVGVSENIGEVTLVRPVVRFNVYVHNHTPFTLTLKDLSFSHFNASQSYLLDHRNADGTPNVPSTVTYSSLPAYNSASPRQIAAPVGDGDDAGKELVYSTLLYENQAKEDYRMFATVSMVNAESEEITKELTTNGVRLITYDEVAAMAEGDTKTVMIVNPTSNSGGFFGMGNNAVFSSAAYTLIDSYESRAEAILKDNQNGIYYSLTLSRSADGKFHLGRIVNSSFKDMFKNVTIGSSSTNNAEDGLTLEEGYIPTTNSDYLLAGGFTGRLCRFKDSSNRYLYNDTNKMRVAAWSERGNRMWAFYEVSPKGSTLKFIDNETAQVKALSSMTRNQELNVVMNVYYEEILREFNFTVDNVYWTDGNAHKPSHQFN